MFGKNVVLKPVWSGDKVASEQVDGQELIVNNIFPTIQGEGPHAGEPSIFIRLTGCNLRCHFCDTEFEKGVPRRIDEIMAAVDVMKEQYPEISLIVLTGGEPLRQQIIPLCYALDGAGFVTQIETAGTLWPPEVKIPNAIAGFPEKASLEDLIESGAVELVCSPKTPVVHDKIVEHCNHFKYIIRAGEVALDGLPNHSTQRLGDRALIYRPPYDNVIPTIWLQPCFEYEPATIHDSVMGRDPQPDVARIVANQSECVKQAMKHGHRISLQLHKILNIE